MANLRLRYQTLEFSNHDIHLCTLRDNQQYSDPEGIAEALGISSASWPIFGIVWPSSLTLAHFIDSYDTCKKRILEVGCGIALPSHLLNAKDADITATDLHPEAESFLVRNTGINEAQPINYQRTDWADKNDSLGTFDLIIGSDLLYEDEHIELLADFLQNHANSGCEIILVDPGRGRKSKLATALAKFGFTSDSQPLPAAELLSKSYKGHIIKFERLQPTG